MMSSLNVENLEILEQVFNVQHSFMRLEVGGGFLVSVFGNLKALRLCPSLNARILKQLYFMVKRQQDYQLSSQSLKA